jgi:hypothetical protein
LWDAVSSPGWRRWRRSAVWLRRLLHL